MSDRGGRFYVHDYADDRGPQEIRPATLIGVELDNGATVELALRDGRVQVRGDDTFAIRPQAANVVEIVPDRDYQRRSRIERALDGDADRTNAQVALERALALANRLTRSDTTRTAAGRESVVAELRTYLAAIRRTL